ncbi:MAG: glycosyltransferase family 4 protein [Aureliella sp.]
MTELGHSERRALADALQSGTLSQSDAQSELEMKGAYGVEKLPQSVAFFTGYVPPYALPVMTEIAARVERMSVFVSTPMEGNRSWDVEHGGLDVVVQRTMTFLTRWKHRAGFSDRSETHVPWDTLFQLTRMRPDVVVSEELGFRSFFCSIYTTLTRTPLVLVCNLSEHTEQGRGMLRGLLRKWLSWAAVATTANGTSGLRYLNEAGFRSDSLALFSYAAKPGVFETLELARRPEQIHRLICVSELSERKGIGPFLRCLAVWCQKNPDQQVKMDIVGEGPIRDELEAIEMPVSASVSFVGQKSYRELASLMQASGVLVFPTLADEWGLVVNEALAAGLPVLGSKYSQAVSDLVEDGYNGWSFDPLDESDTFDSLNHMLTSSDQTIESMRQVCRDSVAERSPTWAAEQLVTVIKSVTTDHGNQKEKTH